MLIEFDKLKRDYQEHQNEIHLKLIAIMSDRLQVHAKSLQVSIACSPAIISSTSTNGKMDMAISSQSILKLIHLAPIPLSPTRTWKL